MAIRSATIAGQTLEVLEDSIREGMGVNKSYLVSYDITAAGKHYNRIHKTITNAIEDNFKSEKVLESQRIIQSVLTVARIRNTLIRAVEKDDQAYVILLVVPLPPLREMSAHGVRLSAILRRFR